MPIQPAFTPLPTGLPAAITDGKAAPAPGGFDATIKAVLADGVPAPGPGAAAIGATAIAPDGVGPLPPIPTAMMAEGPPGATLGARPRGARKIVGDTEAAEPASAVPLPGAMADLPPSLPLPAMPPPPAPPPSGSPPSQLVANSRDEIAAPMPAGPADAPRPSEPSAPATASDHEGHPGSSDVTGFAMTPLERAAVEAVPPSPPAASPSEVAGLSVAPRAAPSPRAASAPLAGPADIPAALIYHPPTHLGAPERLTLRLTPQELGSVTFELRPGVDGSRQIHVLIDRPETLALFEQDRQHLETALQRAGLAAEVTQITYALARDTVPVTPPGDAARGEFLAGGQANAGQSGNGQSNTGQSGAGAASYRRADGEPDLVVPPDGTVPSGSRRRLAGLDIIA